VVANLVICYMLCWAGHAMLDVLLHHLRVLATSFEGLVSAALGWRAAFFIESAAILPFVVFAFVSKQLHLTGSRETGPGGLWVGTTINRGTCYMLCWFCRAMLVVLLHKLRVPYRHL
jgi:hypothetical protein